MRARNAYAGERMRVFYTDVVAIFDEGAEIRPCPWLLTKSFRKAR